MSRVSQGLVRGQFISTCISPIGGFRWADHVDVGLDFPEFDVPFVHTKGPYLVPQSSQGEPALPLAEKDLHRKFARLATDDDILTFANRWGFLGHGITSWVPSVGDNGKPVRKSSVPVESVWYWRSEIPRMQGLLEIWDLVKSARLGSTDARRRLSQCVKWQGNDRVFIRHPAEIDVMSPSRFPSFNTLLTHPRIESTLSLLEHWERGDPVEPTRYYVHNAINERLGGRGDAADGIDRTSHVRPHVLPYMGGDIPALC